MAEDLVLDIDFNITKAEAKTNKLKREFEDSKRKAEKIKNTIESLTEQLEIEKAKQAEIREIIKEQVKEADELARKIEKVESGNATIEEVIDLGNIDTAKAKLAEMESEIQKTSENLKKHTIRKKRQRPKFKSKIMLLQGKTDKPLLSVKKLPLPQRKRINFRKHLKRVRNRLKKWQKSWTTRCLRPCVLDTYQSVYSTS